MAYHLSKLKSLQIQSNHDPVSIWKTPEVEMVGRSFNEYSRYHITNNDQKVHGLKRVPPAVAENIQ